MAKYPCRNCKYFDMCGDNMRTRECKGRETKREEKKQEYPYGYTMWGGQLRDTLPHGARYYLGRQKYYSIGGNKNENEYCRIS